MWSKFCFFTSFVIDMIDNEMKCNLNHFTHQLKVIDRSKNPLIFLLRVKDHDLFPLSVPRVRRKIWLVKKGDQIFCLF